MNKFKIALLSFAALVAIGFASGTPTASASALEPTESITQASASEFESRELNYWAEAVWVTKKVNGVTYSGYIYNRGPSKYSGYWIYTGYLKAGPYAPM